MLQKRKQHEIMQQSGHELRVKMATASRKLVTGSCCVQERANATRLSHILQLTKVWVSLCNELLLC